MAATLLILLSIPCLLIAEQAAPEKRMSVVTYTAPEEGFLSNSHILMGEKEAVLIDAQYSAEEGMKAAEFIKSTGRNLTAIVITHPHTDHYYGLEALGKEFPDAVITGGPRTMEEVRGSMKYWTGEGAESSKFARTEVLTGGEIELEGVPVRYRIFKDGESVENTVLYVPSEGILFMGDLASNGTHMWLGEVQPGNWLAHLKEIRSIDPVRTVYPGHGEKGTEEIIPRAEQYISRFKEAAAGSDSADEAASKMRSLYPDYKLDFILGGSMRAYMPKDGEVHE